MNRLHLIGIALLLLSAGVALAIQTQIPVSSTWNAARPGGAALTVLNTSARYDTSGSSWTLKSDAQIAGHTDPDVYSTGTIVVQGFDQVTVQVNHSVHGAATDVIMACQTKETGGAWLPIAAVDGSTSTARSWSHALTGVTAFSWNFNVNAWGLRCLFWGTSANSTDRITVGVRLAATI